MIDFSRAIPADLRGKSVLDVGCHAGLHSIEVKRRGAARVVGVDSDTLCLDQARFAAEACGYPDIEFRNLSVYGIGRLGEAFDVVIFMGALYDLRHPLLALDMLYGMVNDLLIFQSVQRGSRGMRGARDATNWWIPNRACVKAMLRSAGFTVEDHPEDEAYICRKTACYA